MEYAIISGKTVHIESVSRGTVGECPVCKEKLTAKIGEKRKYFSHDKGRSDCELKFKNYNNYEKEPIIYNLNKSEIDDVYSNKYNDDVPSINGFTNEQLAVINSTEKRIKVNAKVGVGKTSTLEEYIRRHPDERILYLVYSRALREEAEKRFGDVSNVSVRTTYSMAYEKFGLKYRKKLKASINIFDVAKAVNLYMKESEQFMFIDEVQELFEYYLTTNYHNVEDFIEKLGYLFQFEITKKHKNYVIKMFDASLNMKCNITHDFYFKLWHLSKPDFSKNYDTLLVDEFQDSSSALVDIVRTNININKIIVCGDVNQAIFQFANCVNGLEILNEGWKDYPMTKSFRIGNTQAKIISKNMSEILDTNFKLEGYNKNQKVVKSIDYDEPYYYICRYNATILKESLKKAEEGKKIYIEGGKAGVDFNYIKIIYNFKYHNEKHFTLKKFKDYEHMIEYAKHINDYNTIFTDKLINKYGESLIFKIRELENCMVEDWKLAQVCFTTAHRSKGKTFLIPVVMADDFIDFNTIDKEEISKYIPEINVVYVASSRSKFDMEIPDFMLNVFLNGIIDKKFNKVINKEMNNLKNIF